LANDSFTVFQINISSIKVYFNDVVALLGSVKNLFSVVLCETWLLNDFEFKLNNYKTINSLGTLNKCDGVTVLVRESLNVITIKKQVLKNCNSLHITFKINNVLFHLLCIYRSPNDNIDIFVNNLESFLSGLSKKNVYNVICGDINIDIMKNSKISNEYLNIMAFNGFIPCINNYTRVTSYFQTCIDHIFINNIDSNKITSYILRCDITDHWATAIVIQTSNNHKYHNSLSENYNINNININHLDLLINTEDWLSCFNSSNLDTMFDIFNFKMQEFIKYSSISIGKIKPKKNVKAKIMDYTWH